jgi:hypothetical protein
MRVADRESWDAGVCVMGATSGLRSSGTVHDARVAISEDMSW